MHIVIDHAAKRAYVAEERRSAHRNRVFKGAIIRFNGGHSVFECIVRNQNDAGAKLCMDQTFALPLSFGLSIAGSERVRMVRVVWRSPNELGVRFRDQS